MLTSRATPSSTSSYLLQPTRSPSGLHIYFMQSKQDIENWYNESDPWQYETHPDDKKRKDIILSHLTKRYKRALDIGAGEGFLTKDLPADEIHAIEISDQAASRLPSNIKRVHQPEGMYDLIIATGVFYDQYDWQQFHKWIEQHASGLVLTSNIASWEHELPHNPILTQTFPYREYNQHLCLYDFSTTSK